MIGSILSTARGALMAHQIAAQTAAHNTSNAATEGFSRQRAELTPGMPMRTPNGPVGTGVRIADITRSRDSFLDSAFRRENAASQGSSLRHGLLSRVEATVGEPGDTGFSAALDAFWNSWSDLSNDPTNPAARTLVRERGQQVAEHLRRLDGSVIEMRDAATIRVNESVRDLNRLSSYIANLNRDIVSAEAGGRSAPDLRDERDRALDQLSKLADITVIERSKGGIGVIVGGTAIVDDGVATSVSMVNGRVQTEQGRALDIRSGLIGEGLDLLNNVAPALLTGLNDLAAAIVRSVNAIHANGMSVNGATGIDFFDPAAMTAGTLRLSAAVLASTENIAAGSPVDGAYVTGATDIARDIAALRHRSDDPALGSRSIRSFYDGWVTELGISVASSRTSADAHGTLLAQAQTRRESVSGVSTDEELVKLIQHQAAYQAAAKLVSAADEMLRSLITMV